MLSYPANHGLSPPGAALGNGRRALGVLDSGSRALGMLSSGSRALGMLGSGSRALGADALCDTGIVDAPSLLQSA